MTSMLFPELILPNKENRCVRNIGKRTSSPAEGGRRASFPRDLSSPYAAGNEPPFSAPGNDERLSDEYYPQNVGDYTRPAQPPNAAFSMVAAFPRP